MILSYYASFYILYISTYLAVLDVCAAAACSSPFWTEVEPYFAHVTADELSFLHREVHTYIFPLIHLIVGLLSHVLSMQSGLQ